MENRSIKLLFFDKSPTHFFYPLSSNINYCTSIFIFYFSEVSFKPINSLLFGYSYWILIYSLFLRSICNPYCIEDLGWTVWNFVLAKSCLWRWIEKCDGLTLSCCPRNLQEKTGEVKKKAGEKWRSFTKPAKTLLHRRLQKIAWKFNSGKHEILDWCLAWSFLQLLLGHS